MRITWLDVKNDLPSIIAQEGDDFVYLPPGGADDTCRYEWDGAASCLIARYLVSLGFPLEAFHGFEGSDIQDAIQEGLFNGTDFSAEPEAILAMYAVQNLQDTQFLWGDAYSQVFEPTN